MVVFPAFFPNKRRKLCFVTNVLKIKQLSCSILRDIASFKYQAKFRAISQDNCEMSTQLLLKKEVWFSSGRPQNVQDEQGHRKSQSPITVKDLLLR